MLRITTHFAQDALTFQVEGRLVGPWVAELRGCWQQTPQRDRHAARIDLRAVTFVDAAGERLLTELHRQGATLVAGGCQMKALVAEIKSSNAQPR